MGIPGSFHQHYAMVTALSAELQQQLAGFVLSEAYTLSKEELVMVFEQEGRCLTINIVQQFQTCFLFFDSKHPDKSSNAQPCFDAVFGQAVEVIRQHPFNRSFEMVMANGSVLVFKLYDGLVNVLLFENGIVTDLFRKSITNDRELTQGSFLGNDTGEILDIKGVYVYKRINIHPFYLALLPQTDELILHTTSVMEAYSVFSRYALNNYRFVYLKQQLVNNTKHLIEKTGTNLKQLEQSIASQKEQTSDEEIGHIIMANLHAIRPQSNKAELFDFYHNKSISVKLKKDLNPQQNAAYYYRKAKNSQIEEAKQLELVASLKGKIVELQEKLVQIEAAEVYRELKSFVKTTATEQKRSPFRVFTINGFDIWVGKNAANNDELTIRSSHKNDLWLHAKDVTGSHVLIKWKPGKPYPNEVIEAAAQIAAYYSKLKGSGLVPVAYTPKKFVRKPKGAEPGSVVVDKEEVMMVTPKLPA
jgi:predicted ribosome quality control (RQC) complex YloA/Tae2 family protein